MRLPIDHELARSAVSKMVSRSLLDPLSGPLSGAERNIAQQIATSLLSGGERELVGPASAEKWVIRRYQEDIGRLPFELSQALEIDIASNPNRSGLLLEKYVQSLLVPDESGDAPIASVVREVPAFEPDRARDVSAEPVRLFQAAYRMARLIQVE